MLQINFNYYIATPKLLPTEYESKQNYGLTVDVIYDIGSGNG